MSEKMLSTSVWYGSPGGAGTITLPAGKPASPRPNRTWRHPSSTSCTRIRSSGSMSTATVMGRATRSKHRRLAVRVRAGTPPAAPTAGPCASRCRTWRPGRPGSGPDPRCGTGCGPPRYAGRCLCPHCLALTHSIPAAAGAAQRRRYARGRTAARSAARRCGGVGRSGDGAGRYRWGAFCARGRVTTAGAPTGALPDADGVPGVRSRVRRQWQGARRSSAQRRPGSLPQRSRAPSSGGPTPLAAHTAMRHRGSLAGCSSAEARR